MKSNYRIQGDTYLDDALISPGTLLFVYDNIGNPQKLAVVI